MPNNADTITVCDLVNQTSGVLTRTPGAWERLHLFCVFINSDQMQLLEHSRNRSDLCGSDVEFVGIHFVFAAP